MPDKFGLAQAVSVHRCFSEIQIAGPNKLTAIGEGVSASVAALDNDAARHLVLRVTVEARPIQPLEIALGVPLARWAFVRRLGHWNYITAQIWVLGPRLGADWGSHDEQGGGEGVSHLGKMVSVSVAVEMGRGRTVEWPTLELSEAPCLSSGKA
jgi:hypothetical protein